jgi:hypothetical protein
MTNQDGSIFIVRFKTADDEQQAEELTDSLNVNKQVDYKESTASTLDNEPNAAVYGNINAEKDIINSFIAGTSCLNGVILIFFKDIIY